MFTKTQIIAAAVVAASTLAVNAAPTYMNVVADVEARGFGNGGWIKPSAGKNNKAKTRQAHEVAAIEHHKQTSPNHPAVAPGNTATVHDSWHQSNGGPVHSTVKYSDSQGKHVTTLHIGKDGKRQQGSSSKSHQSGYSAPPGSPSRREELEVRGFGNGGWIKPSAGKNNKAKTRQAHEVAAIEHHKQTSPNHPAVAPGNTATVHDSWHQSNGGPVHSTVKYTDSQGKHVTTLHIGKDGKRQQGSSSTSHQSGYWAPPGSPSRREELEVRGFGNGGWIKPSAGKNNKAKTRQAHEIAAIEHHKQTSPNHPAVAPGNTATVHDSWHQSNGGPVHSTVKYSDSQGKHVTTLHIGKDGKRQQGSSSKSHQSGYSAPPGSPSRREIEDILARAMELYDELD
ncbi:hypothetical protein NLJ89_g8096 [Agrocybe chaxingu]|uniref:Uncharacterized protein n=1 Tax=Agrocybe chaxingu TaxID=84603 RepID=A0A9W8JY18_9AGAR|nr:hypothetical protein NLJ89_g8096 [Agrocybe chaxingu]